MTVPQSTQRNSVSIQSGIQQGMQQRQPVAQQSRSPNSRAVGPTALFGIVRVVRRQLGHSEFA